jgi:hypothetical protein
VALRRLPRVGRRGFADDVSPPPLAADLGTATLLLPKVRAPAAAAAAGQVVNAAAAAVIIVS